MDFKRTFLYAALFFVMYSLWMAWQTDYPTNSTDNHQQSISEPQDTGLIPHLSDASNAVNAPVKKAQSAPLNTAPQGQLIEVETDTVKALIDTYHGDIVRLELIDYPSSLEAKHSPFVLLNNDEKRYVANSSLFVKKQGAVDNLQFNYKSKQSSYRLEPGQDSLTVSLEGVDRFGLKVTKNFLFVRNQYLIDVQYGISNDTGAPWTGYLNTQLLRESPAEDKSSLFHVGTFIGASMSNPAEKLYKKISFSDMEKRNISQAVDGGWLAMQEHYFLSAWIPTAGTSNHFYTLVRDSKYIIGAVSSPITLSPGEATSLGAKLYAGPELTPVLSTIAPGLELTVDYGWLWFISKYLFMAMSFIHSLIGNWGWSIVGVTVLIKLAFYRLSAKSYRSMAAMRKLQPKIEALKERCGDDKAKLSQATMELYRKDKVNPLGGCLPILIQIPVFIGLYWVLLESVQLRQAPWILWIHDLAAKDPYYILPVIMGATMLIQQKLNPPPSDPMQAKVMMLLPVLFTFLFLSFPAGLVLYWVVNNSLSILQQWYITKKFSDTPAKKKGSTKKLAAAK